jgi:uncharacterized protein (TIGR00297 family)
MIPDSFLFKSLVVLLFSIVSYRMKFLTVSGAIAQFIIGTLLFGFGGLQWTIPIVVFFLSSSLLSKIRKPNGESIDASFAKSSRRDVWQVVANGGVAGLMMILRIVADNEFWYWGYLGSIAAATSDTWGTEVGVLSKSRPRLVTTMKKVDAGTSGAVSMLGTVAGAVGAGTIFLSSTFWLSTSNMMNGLIALFFAGTVGSLMDSLLGATLQIQYSCKKCGRFTERREHCGSRTSRIRGISMVNNDVVNLLCTLCGGAIGIVVGNGWLV